MILYPKTSESETHR